MSIKNIKDNILIAVLSGLLLISLSIILSLGFQNLNLRNRKMICQCPMGCPRGNDSDSQGTITPEPYFPEPTELPTDYGEPGPISEVQLLRGWYWGTEEQRLSGTPDSWIYTEAGRSSCWHEKSVPCAPASSKYTCPLSGWIDCMPTVGRNDRTYECTQEAIAWYRENCPGFEGVAY